MVAITKLPGQTVACICPCRTKFAIHASLPLPRVSRRYRSQSLTRVISGSQSGNARFPRMGSRSVVCSCHIADHELMMRWQKAVSRATGKFFFCENCFPPKMRQVHRVCFPLIFINGIHLLVWCFPSGKSLSETSEGHEGQAFYKRVGVNIFDIGCCFLLCFDFYFFFFNSDALKSFLTQIISVHWQNFG